MKKIKCIHCNGTGTIEVSDEKAQLMSLGEQIRYLRKKCGLTQGELAQAIGLTRTSIANLEVGRQNIVFSKLVRIADALGVRIDELLK